MEILWQSYGNPMDILWKSYGNPLEYVMTDSTVAFDDQSGAPLKPELMRRARKDEIQHFKDMKVYEKVPIEECRQETGQAPIPVRWVDINNGDQSSPKYRSRLVAKEYKTDLRQDLYAATPPSECLRRLASPWHPSRAPR